MELTAQVIANHVGGKIVGDPSARVSTVAKIEQGKPGDLCFLANAKYEQHLYTCNASIILLNNSFELKQDIIPTIIRVENAYQAIASLLDLFNSFKLAKKRGRSLWSRISFSAKIGRRVYIGSFAYVGKKTRIGNGTMIYPQSFIGDSVTIGENCIIYSGAKIYPGTIIGNNCIIHSNAVIGSDGFGFAPTEDGSYKKIPQTGVVEIEDNCEIGANTVIDRATMGKTLIEKGVKLDNLIQVAHNVIIGSNTVIAAQTGIAGSSKIGKNCAIGGQVGITGHISIADDTGIGAQSGIMSSIKKPNSKVMGSPAFNYMDYLKASAIFRNIHKK